MHRPDPACPGGPDSDMQVGRMKTVQPARPILRFLVKLRTWIVRLFLIALAVELFSFAAISLSNYAIYGSAFEGSRAVYDAHTVFLQKDGLRGTAFNQACGDPARDRVIWMFGGSTMRGNTDDDAATIPSVVARELNRGSSTGACWTVVNFGVNSFNSLLEVKYLQKCLIEEEQAPDLVVFYDGANDSTYFVQYRTPYAHHGCQQVGALVASYRNRRLGILKPLNAAFYASFTRELYGKLRAVAGPLAADDPGLAEFTRLTALRYDHARTIARAYGADFLIAWQPMLWTETGAVADDIRRQEAGYTMNPNRFRIYGDNVSLVYEALRSTIAAQDDFACFRNVACARTGLVYKADGVHMTDYGRERVGLALAAEIRRRMDPP